MLVYVCKVSDIRDRCVSYACIYACMYVCMYVCIFVRLVYVFKFLYVCDPFFYACTFVCMYICFARLVYVYIHFCMYVIRFCMHVCVYALPQV